MHVNNRATPQVRQLFFTLLILVVFLSGCSKACSQTEVDNVRAQIESIHTSFTDLNNQSMNHPEFKTTNIETMKDMIEEFKAVELPKCTKDLSKLVLAAMQSSVDYLSPPAGNFYYPYQLAKFAMDDWENVEKAMNKLQLTVSE